MDTNINSNIEGSQKMKKALNTKTLKACEQFVTELNDKPEFKIPEKNLVMLVSGSDDEKKYLNPESHHCMGSFQGYVNGSPVNISVYTL